MKSSIEVLKDVQTRRSYKVIPEPVLVAGLLELDQKTRKLEQSKQDKPIAPADYIANAAIELFPDVDCALAGLTTAGFVPCSHRSIATSRASRGISSGFDLYRDISVNLSSKCTAGRKWAWG
jgi:hypothetical protein